MVAGLISGIRRSRWAVAGSLLVVVLLAALAVRKSKSHRVAPQGAASAAAEAMLHIRH